MEIRTETSERGLVVRIRGPLDERGSEAMHREVTGLSLTDIDLLIFDFSEVTYIGSSGVGVLILAYKQFSNQNVKMVVTGLSADNYGLMKSLDMHKLMKLEQSG